LVVLGLDNFGVFILCEAWFRVRAIGCERAIGFMRMGDMNGVCVSAWGVECSFAICGGACGEQQRFQLGEGR
jgi:hypothetical protein